MSELLTGKIAEWDDRRGFGFVDHKGQRVFLHIRDYAGRSHLPRRGDRVSFLFGQDEKGRTCAKGARTVTSRSRLHAVDILSLSLLLVLPLVAAMQSPVDLWIVVAVAFVLSWSSWRQYAFDKRCAQTKAWRIPEASLHFWDFVGGWPGGYLAQKYYRHKTVKGSFQFVFWGTVCLYQWIAFDYLGDWSLSRAFLTALESPGQ
jgi:uncharacterized membrane protein YsdA (DUF1294 family)/cold shock CspA family protein